MDDLIFYLNGRCSEKVSKMSWCSVKRRRRKKRKKEKEKMKDENAREEREGERNIFEIMNDLIFFI